MVRGGSSRARYRTFVQLYKRRQLDDAAEGADAPGAAGRPGHAKRREYLRD